MDEVSRYEADKNKLPLTGIPATAYNVATNPLNIVSPVGGPVGNVRLGLLKRGAKALGINVPDIVTDKKEAKRLKSLPVLPFGEETEEDSYRPVLTKQDMIDFGDEGEPGIDEGDVYGDEEDTSRLSFDEAAEYYKNLREKELAALKQFEQGGIDANLGKAAQLIASGIIGSSAGKKGGYMTLPELQGKETWDSLGKQGERKIASLEYMKKLEEGSPTSIPSRQAQDYYIDFLKSVRGQALDKNTIKTIRGLPADRLEDMMKYEVLAGKLGAQRSRKGDDFITSTAGKVMPIAKAYDKLFEARRIADKPLTDNPAEDITSIYSYIKALDPDSAVRGSEVELVQQVSGFMQRLETTFNRYKNAEAGDVAAKSAIKQIQKEMKNLERIAREKYELKMNPWRKQAASRGLADRIDEFDPYREQIRNLQIIDYANEYFNGNVEKAKAHFEKHGY